MFIHQTFLTWMGNNMSHEIVKCVWTLWWSYNLLKHFHIHMGLYVACKCDHSNNAVWKSTYHSPHVDKIFFSCLCTSMCHFNISLFRNVLPAQDLEAQVRWPPPAWLSMCLLSWDLYKNLWLQWVQACFFLSSSCMSMWFLYPVVDSNCLPHWSHFQFSSLAWCFSMWQLYACQSRNPHLQGLPMGFLFWAW